MYTMEDIGNFIDQYKSTLPKEPIVLTRLSAKMRERYTLEVFKRNVFEKEYLKKSIATKEEQEKFIRDMTPVLDEFYSKHPNFILENVKQ